MQKTDRTYHWKQNQTINYSSYHKYILRQKQDRSYVIPTWRTALGSNWQPVSAGYSSPSLGNQIHWISSLSADIPGDTSKTWSRLLQADIRQQVLLSQEERLDRFLSIEQSPRWVGVAGALTKITASLSEIRHVPYWLFRVVRPWQMIMSKSIHWLGCRIGLRGNRKLNNVGGLLNVSVMYVLGPD